MKSKWFSGATFKVVSLVLLCFFIVNASVSQLSQESRFIYQLSNPMSGIWKASPISIDCTGPSDINGHPWYDPDFDDTQWSDVQLPEVNTIPSGQDRYYRMHYNLAVSSSTKILLSTDDGAWLYVNGQFVGHWGADCHGAERADNVLIDITPYIYPGKNLIAVHVSNGPSNSQFNVVLPPRIILPMDSQVTVEFISTSTDCTGNFGLYSPHNIPIYNDYLYQQGVSFPIDERFAVGTELVFYLIPQQNICGGHTYLSNDPSRTRIEHPNDFTWRIKWEDWTDADFNDLVVEVRLGGTVTPFLELPFDYTNIYSTFIRAAGDSERRGTVNSYFDHHYPTYAEDDRVVTFHGYDSQSDMSGFGLAYDGHDGIDFAVSGQDVNVFPAADGTVVDIVTATPGTCDCRRRGGTINERCLGNHVVISHTNGFVTTYGHLARFSDSISDSIEENPSIERSTSIGVMGSTGCSTASHIHFQVTNPAGVRVDPFGWIPFPDSSYGRSGEPDPWQQYQQNQQPPRDGTSHYLWIHPLDRRVLNNQNQPTLITSVSGEITAIFPVGAYGEPYRIELWDTLNSPNIVDVSAIFLSTFALYAYDRNEQPIWSLIEPIQIEFRSKDIEQTTTQSVNTLSEYYIYQWNEAAQQWDALATTYDAQTGLVSTSSPRLGRFAVAKIGSVIFLPLVIRNQ